MKQTEKLKTGKMSVDQSVLELLIKMGIFFSKWLMILRVHKIYSILFEVQFPLKGLGFIFEMDSNFYERIQTTNHYIV